MPTITLDRYGDVREAYRQHDLEHGVRTTQSRTGHRAVATPLGDGGEEPDARCAKYQHCKNIDRDSAPEELPQRPPR